MGDFSRATHLSVKTPRHYHQAGLLEPAAVNPDTGYRYYSAGQIPAAQVIRRLRDLEMPVADVKAVLARRTRPPQRPHRRAPGPTGGRAGPSSAPTPPVLTGKPCYSNSIYYDRSRDRWTGTITVGWKPDGRRTRSLFAAGPRPRSRTSSAPSMPNSPQASAPPANYTVEQCLKDWLEALNTQAESTLTGYRIMVRHLAGLIGDVKLAELKVRDVDFALGKLAKRLSTRSVRLARMILTQAIRNAMVNDLVVRNVADLAAVPTGKPGRPSKSLGLDQALAVLDAAEGERLWPYVAVSMLGGIRTEEARALRWSEVDLEAGTSYVAAGDQPRSRGACSVPESPSSAGLVLKQAPPAKAGA